MADLSNTKKDILINLICILIHFLKTNYSLVFNQLKFDFLKLFIVGLSTIFINQRH